MGLLGHVAVLLLVLKEPPALFSVVTVPVYLPTAAKRGSLLSTFPLGLTVCRFFDHGHSDQCQVCSFVLHFSCN